jgi:hypothetical protein
MYQSSTYLKARPRVILRGENSRGMNIKRLTLKTNVWQIRCMPRVSANGDAIGNRNKSVNQYGVCHEVEYRPSLRRSRPVFLAGS